MIAIYLPSDCHLLQSDCPTQEEDGRVATWVEANSHPHVTDPGKDGQRYYLGSRRPPVLGTRRSATSSGRADLPQLVAFLHPGTQGTPCG